MYGTVARMKVKAGMEGKLVEITRSYEGLKIPGHRMTYVDRLDSGNNEYILTAVFDSREAYHKNANDPAQNARYMQMRALLDADPEWHDGEIIYSA